MTTLLCAFSDWHIGREDMPTYERAMQLPDRIKNHKMLPRKLDAVAMAFIGDLTDGTCVFPQQPALNNTTLPEQFEFTRRAMVHTIKGLSALGEAYAYMEPGNHGRISKFAHPHDNIERILYDTVMREVADCATCFPPDDNEHAIAEIEDTAVLIEHKGPAHIETKTRRCDGLSALREHGGDVILCAHLHHVGASSQGFWHFRNGTLMNRGERHAASLKLFDPPRQLCLVIDGDCVIGSFWVEF